MRYFIFIQTTLEIKLIPNCDKFANFCVSIPLNFLCVSFIGRAIQFPWTTSRSSYDIIREFISHIPMKTMTVVRFVSLLGWTIRDDDDDFIVLARLREETREWDSLTTEMFWYLIHLYLLNIFLLFVVDIMVGWILHRPAAEGWSWMDQ